MKKKGLARIPNWTIGLAITGLICSSFLFGGSGGFLSEIELKTYDLRMKLFATGIESDRIAIVAIDEESIRKLGRWPWPRDRIAGVIGKLQSAGARVIGLNILFSEPEESTGLRAVKVIKDGFAGLGLDKTKVGKGFYNKLLSMERELDNDAKLESSIRGAKNLVLPFAMNVSSGAPGGGGVGGEVPAFVKASALSALVPPGGDTIFFPPVASSALYPTERLGKAGATLGHLNKFPGKFPDGIDRWEALVIEFKGALYPSFALSVASRYLGHSPTDVTADLRPEAGTVGFGSSVLATDEQMGILINYYDRQSSFPVYSFFDVTNDKINQAVFKDKIVLLGITDLGLGDVSPTPIAPVFSSVEREATVIENLLTLRTIVEPWWSRLAVLGALLVFGVLTTVALSRLQALGGIVLSLFLFTFYVGGAFYLFTSERLWLEVTHPALLIALNYLAISSKKFLFTEREKIAAESESDEANKLLGLTFQSKGMLEMAFEKFKTIPVLDDEMKDVLYNLGMDFEKKRSWAQAASAYERIADKKFKDVPDRIERLSGYASGAAPVSLKGDKATILSEGAERPTLGRYEVLHELGRGAMGVVYLGKDPKINRQVAIKTVNFDEVEEKMIDTLKERFFREAQSAGTLNHPNILTIYDVGEEGNLAYIAMELIDGKDLDIWTESGRLLPLKDALMVVAKVADALDFAHSHGIIHRDIKPANIMVTKKSEIKVTDFGIARIQSASQTKTGTVMGTPSYMSPEQVAGKKVDGKSDVFSLGVVLYELLSANRPFTGDSLATIMYNITNSPPTPLDEYKKGLPKFCQALIDKALAKESEKRFQSAGEFAKAIRWCLQKYGSNL